jgi:purine-binding chemotaxis protein CheW
MRTSKSEQEQAAPKAVVQYLTFYTAGEEYAVNIGKVKEIVKYEAITVVPNTPAWIRGVTNLRGTVVPVVDLAVKFGLAASGVSKLSCIIIAELLFQGEPLIFGVLADSVCQVVELTEDDVQETPPFGTRVRADYLLGMGPMGKKFCLILDIDKVLAADEFLTGTESTSGDATHQPVADRPSNQQSQARMGR